MKKILISILIFCTIFSSTVLNKNVFAMDTFYSNNDILFYDSSDTMCSSGSITTKLSGINNEEKIFNFWLSKGLSPEQSAGIAGNIKNESGYSPFRQQESSTWPSGGYGITQFTGDQRSRVYDFLLKTYGETFTKYYSDTYGSGVSEKNNYIPSGITEEINDIFLLGELNYLAEYTSGFDPNSISVRISGLKTDQNIDYISGMKLLDFMKTLTTSSDSAKAWLYLYEQPADIKTKVEERSNSAEIILNKYKYNASNISNCMVGVGGLSFEQAKTLGEYYYNNRFEFLAGTTFSESGMSNQCTAFSYYFNTRFISTGTGSGNGKDVAINLVASMPDEFTKTDTSNLQPFSIFSLTNSVYGHTGVIAGLGSDGSVITIEANSDLSSLGESSGLTEKMIFGDSSNQTTGVVSIGHWRDIQSWVSAMSSWGLNDPVFASPINQESVSNKIQESL